MLILIFCDHAIVCDYKLKTVCIRFIIVALFIGLQDVADHLITDSEKETSELTQKDDLPPSPQTASPTLESAQPPLTLSPSLVRQAEIRSSISDVMDVDTCCSLQNPPGKE